MAAEFSISIITPERPCPDEPQKIAALLEHGAADAVHLRHPGLSAEEQADLLAQVPKHQHSRVIVHEHYEYLLSRFALAGAQLGGRASAEEVEWLRSAGVPLFKSCHSVEEVETLSPMFAGCTLSPIFPSISKSGYSADFTEADLRRATACGKRVVALGGITPERVEAVRALGFSGAAMLGWVWQGNFWQRLRRLRMLTRFRLQYITNGATPAEVEAEVRQVLAGGCRWVQIRMKDAPDSAVEEAARLVKPLTDEAGAILLLDDRVELAAALGVSGVHLGKNDMPAAQARAILPEHMIIGCTANTLADVQAIAQAGASDYIGLGPLRFTTTKKNLAPTLGIEGYRTILGHARAEGIDLPVVAIGSVALADCAPLLEAGANGVAVSGAIRRAANPAAQTSLFLDKLLNYHTQND